MSSPRTLIPSDEARVLALSEAVQTSAAGIVSRTVLQSAELRVVLFAFADGQELTTHTSKRRALVQILEGECDFFFAGKWQRLAAGALLHMPPEHEHAVRAAAGPFSMLLTLGAEAAPSSATANTSS
jgi:quercetin dioxygenase-like cupin family protein